MSTASRTTVAPGNSHPSLSEWIESRQAREIPEREVTTHIEVADYFDQRDAALRAHATQIDPDVLSRHRGLHCRGFAVRSPESSTTRDPTGAEAPLRHRITFRAPLGSTRRRARTPWSDRARATKRPTPGSATSSSPSTSTWPRRRTTSGLPVTCVPS